MVSARDSFYSHSQKQAESERVGKHIPCSHNQQKDGMATNIKKQTSNKTYHKKPKKPFYIKSQSIKKL